MAPTDVMVRRGACDGCGAVVKVGTVVTVPDSPCSTVRLCMRCLDAANRSHPTARHADVMRAARAAAMLAIASRHEDAGYWQGGVVSPPNWLFDAVAKSLPFHMGYGYVEGIRVQRGTAARGGFRFAREDETEHDAERGWPVKRFVGLHKLVPRLLIARYARLIREGCPP